MTDTSDTAPPSLQQRVMAFMTGPAGQSIIRRALSGSGVLGVWLVHRGFPEADLGPLTDFIVAITPFVLTEIWAQITKTHKAIIGQAAKILAERQINGQPSGTIIISQGAGDGAAKAVADPAMPNVVPAGSPAAMAAATSEPPIIKQP